MNIQEDYVSFETAKLLKEKGFDEKLQYYYDTDGILVRCHRGQYFSNKSNAFIAPTQAMTMKWLRDIYKLDIDVSIEYKKSKKVYYYSILKKTVIRDIDCLHSETNFDSYEEACESAIRYCLEHLI